MRNSQKLLSVWIGDIIHRMNHKLLSYQDTCCCIDLLQGAGKASGKCFCTECDKCIGQFLNKKESEGSEMIYLWHYKLIPYMPTNILVEQWKMCLIAAEQIHRKGECDDISAKPISNYPIQQFRDYCNMIAVELMVNREYYIHDNDFKTLDSLIGFELDMTDIHRDIFTDWHNDAYMSLCLLNLSIFKNQKLITEEEYNTIMNTGADILLSSEVDT